MSLENMPGPGLIPDGAGLTAGWMEHLQKIGDAGIALLGGWLDKLTGAVLELADGAANKAIGAVVSGTNHAASAMNPSHMVSIGANQEHSGHELARGRNVGDETPIRNMDQPDLPEKSARAVDALQKNTDLAYPTSDVNIASTLGTGAQHGINFNGVGQAQGAGIKMG